MNCSDEFTSPIATSTVWKKKKPENWAQEQETTFQQLVDLTNIESPSNKENVDSNNTCEKTCDSVGSGSAAGTAGDSTLNLWKYLVPAHPAEMEEDSFIVDNTAYKMNQDGPDTPEQDLFSEKLAQDLANLDLLCENSNDLSKSNPISHLDNTPNVAVDPVHIATPIPGFIITDRNVLLRRHSSVMNDTPMRHCSNDDNDQCRNILSAPPSIYITEASDIQHIDLEEDTAQEDATKVVCKDFLDDFESEEDLINESFCKYFEEVPDIYTPECNDENLCRSLSLSQRSSSPLIICDEVKNNTASDNDSEISTNLGHSIGVVDDNVETDSLLETESLLENKSLQENEDTIVSTSRRKSQGSLNTVPYVDPENSMTTETLDIISPDYDNATNFNLPPNDDEESDEEPVRLTFEETGDINEFLTEENESESEEEGNEYRQPSFNTSPEKHHHTILEKIRHSQHKKEIIFPSSFTVENPCPAGITQKLSLKIENKTDLWLQCSITVDDPGQENGFSCSKNRLIVPPLSDEDLCVCLCAKRDGLCLGTVELTLNSVISGMLKEQHRSCKITAIAELPDLHITPQAIQFGVQFTNKEASYELKNSSQYDLPLKIVLEANQMDDVFALSDPMSNYPTAVFTLNLGPQQLFVGHIEFCPFDQLHECEAKLKVYIDAPNGAVLCESKITGTVGHYKLRIPVSKHFLSFHSTPGVPQSIPVPFRNTGNIASAVRLEASGPFNVTPAYIPSLVPGEDGLCQVSYFPVVTEHISGRLTLSLGVNDDTVFEVPLEAKCTVSKAQPSAPHVSPLLANKSILNFGGADIGRQKEEKLVLKNDSHTQLMCLVLRIISPCRSFYILNDNISLSCDMVLPAGSSQTVTLGYTPLHPDQHVGELLVKCTNTAASFSIPLSGHGGLSKVSVLNAHQTSSRMWVDMSDIIPNSRNTTRITLHNTGARAAFVSGVLENDDGFLLPPNLGWINPSSFVIPKNTSRDLFIIYDPRETEPVSPGAKNRVALLKLFCGDEIARQRYCAALKTLECSLHEQEMPFDPTVEFLIPADSACQEQEKVPHLKQSDMVFERKLFGSALYQLFISVLGRNGESSSSMTNKPPLGRRGQPLLPLEQREVEARAKKHNPVVQEAARKTAPSWDFSVEELHMTGFTTFYLVNDSREQLVYDVSFEGTLYTISPVTGCVPPCGCSEISVKPHSATKPFISTILVTAGGHNKTLKVVHAPIADPPKPNRFPTTEPRISPQQSSTLEEKTVSFKTIPVNKSTAAFFEFTNTYGGDIQWRLCSLAPAYTKIDEREPRRVQYSAFCVGIISGVTPNSAKESIPITFYPKDVGHFTQCWTFTYNLAELRSLKHKRRIIFEGMATAAGSSSQARPNDRVQRSRPNDRVFLKTSQLDFASPVNERESLSFKIGNPLKEASKVEMSAVRAPFYLKYKEIWVEAGHSARVPVRFRATKPGSYSDSVIIQTDRETLELVLTGTAT